MAEFNYAVFAGNVGQIYEKRSVGKDNRSVVDFTVAYTPRRRNQQTNEWEDGNTQWRRITAWNRLADNFVESFKPGDRIIVIGTYDKEDPWEDKEGNQREGRDFVRAIDLGHSIQRWSAQTERNPSQNAGGNRNNNSNANTSKKKADSQESKSDNPFDDPLDLGDDLVF